MRFSIADTSHGTLPTDLFSFFICFTCNSKQVRGQDAANKIADSRADKAESAETLRLSPLGVVPMRADYGGLMWSCRDGGNANGRGQFI